MLYLLFSKFLKNDSICKLFGFCANVTEDDNINKVFYCAKGEIGENPHTEVYITDVNNSVNLFKSMLV